MRIVKLDPSLLTSQDRSFILKFSLLEHDLLHFFENKNYEHATNILTSFLETAHFKIYLPRWCYSL